MAIGMKLRQVAKPVLVLLFVALAGPGALAADSDQPAKELFGAAKLPSLQNAQPIGFYSKGCLAGGVALPADGPTWQAMRLSRNRRWGHPDLIALVERLSREAAKFDGWPGLLVGDIAQPRGGPMLSGHASHQVGLDADIWLTPMPSRTLTATERETMSAVSMLKGDSLYVDPEIWTKSRARLLMRAANYPQVQRIFVHPGIKKQLCDNWTGDRSNMGKLRPYWGHYYHFHIRMHCPEDANNCRPQKAIARGTGCGKSLAWWFTDEPWKPADPDKPKPEPRQVKLSDLPKACTAVIDAPAPASQGAVTYYAPSSLAPLSAAFSMPGLVPDPASVPLPIPRPFD